MGILRFKKSKISLKTLNRTMIASSMESKVALKTRLRMLKTPLKLQPVGSGERLGTSNDSGITWTTPTMPDEMKSATTMTTRRDLQAQSLM